MTTYTINGLGAPPGGSSSTATGSRTDGVYFTVSSACTFSGFYYYAPSGESNLAGSGYSGTLYTAASLKASTAASTVISSTAGSGTFTAAAWNLIPVTPVTLSTSTIYIAAVTHPDALQFLANYWLSDGGLGGAAGITSGPVNAPTAGPTGAQTSFQQCHAAGSAFPNTSGGTWYGVDIQVSDIAAAAAPAPPPLMPPGFLSPAAWQAPHYLRLGQVTTIAGSGGVVLPKPSLSGAGALTARIALPASPLMPPGLSSPAAWQFPRYPRLGQTMTIAGSGGVVLPKPSLSGSGLLTVTGSGGVVLPKPSLSLSGSVAAASGIARPPLMPPGLRSPAAWQRPRYARLPLTVTSTGITGSGGVTLPKPSLAASSPPPVTAAAGQGGWWQLHGIITAAAQEREFWDAQPAMACPRCGEPLRPAPPSDSGSSVESYCQFDGWRYPGDWDASTMSGM